jgi:hypothetical protein
MSRRTALVPALLLAGLVVAIIGATAALRLIGDGAFGPGGRAMTEADVRRSLAQATPAAATRSAAPAATRSAVPPATPGRAGTRGSRSPSPGGTQTGGFQSTGGMVFAACSAGQVTLTSWVAAPGYGTGNVSPGPAGSAWVKFKSGTTEVTVSTSCAGGKPAFSSSSDDRGGETHGGGGGGGGPGRGGSGRGGGGGDG